MDPTNPNLSAKGKVVLVTGGGRGIGRAIAQAFASAGARAVVILGRTTSTLENAEKDIAAAASAAGCDTVARSFVVDIRHSVAVPDTIKLAVQELGAFDVFVSNAATNYMTALHTSSVDEYWSSFEVNVKGMLNCMQAFLNYGIDRDAKVAPTLINVSTIGIAMTPVPTMSLYAASKLAAWKMAECLDVEMGNNIRVFSIHPGRIATDMP